MSSATRVASDVPLKKQIEFRTSDVEGYYLCNLARRLMDREIRSWHAKRIRNVELDVVFHTIRLSPPSPGSDHLLSDAVHIVAILDLMGHIRIDIDMAFWKANHIAKPQFRLAIGNLTGDVKHRLLHIVGKWITLDTLLDRMRGLRPISRSIPRQSCISLMQQWWRVTDKVFPIFKLPLELRELIYLSVCGYFVGRRKASVFSWCRMSDATSLMLTCKRIAAECRATVFRRSTFLFASQADTLLLRHTSAADLSKITRLELTFQDLDTFYRFFGHAKDGGMLLTRIKRNVGERFDVTKSPCSAANIRNMRLQSLILQMPSLRLDMQRDWTFDACPGYNVSFMLNLAWPHIVGQPITLTGCLKPQEKAEFEAFAGEAHQYRGTWESLRRKVGLPPGDGDDGWDTTAGGGVELQEESPTTRMEVARWWCSIPKPEILARINDYSEDDAISYSCQCMSPCMPSSQWKMFRPDQSITKTSY